MENKVDKGHWGTNWAEPLLREIYPNIERKAHNYPIVDLENPAVQVKMRSYKLYGDAFETPQDWEPTNESLEKGLQKYDDYLNVLIFHDDQEPRHLKYGALISAKDAVNGEVKWNLTKMDGQPVHKISLVEMHKHAGQWPKVHFFNNEKEFREKMKAFQNYKFRQK